jgi:Na+-translocating ferredoxin:NAD+ oxidoreductase RNF subunit RnfB
MNASVTLLSVAILGGVGLTFGILIAVAHRKGLPGCRGFAEAAVRNEVAPAECTVMGEDEREDVAMLLGVEAGEANKRVARLLCAGGSDVAMRKAEYYGIESCGAALAVGGGGKGCAWGCVGLADCAVACDFDAIVMNDVDLPVVIPEACTACGDCVDACPLDLFVILPLDAHLIVQCRCLLEGETATGVCEVACDACGRCAVDAASGLIEMRDGLAVIDYDRIDLEDLAATARCPTGAIAWVEGAQFGAGEPSLVGSEV